MRKLLVLAGLACQVAGAASASAAAPVARRPNVLVICADDHAAYVTAAYGNRQVRTPNVDRLAAGGIRFERAYCNSPVCTASRQSFLTGRYPRTIGVTRLETALPASEETLSETLRRAGFDTAGIGKMHFNSNLRHGFDFRLDLEDHRRWLAAQPTATAPPEGPVQPPWRPFKNPARIWLNSDCRPMGLADSRMDGTYFAQEAAAYIEREHAKPFFLMVSFYEPHSPFRFPLEYRGRHQPSAFSIPAVGSEDDDQIPAVFRELTNPQKQGIAAAYHTSVEFLDKNVGLLLDALDRAGHADDTIVIYLSDHGYLLGQHGRFEKHSSYEEAIRTPLAIRFPPRITAARVSRALVELIDLVPTVCGLLNLPAPPAVQGRSLIDLLADKTTRHREHVIVEYAPNDEVMIRDEQWKLVYERGVRRRTDGYDTARPLTPNRFRLYDLAQDPQEMHNVADDAANAATRARLTSLLVDHLKMTAREPQLVPRTADALSVLEFCVQPRDVASPAGGE
jgi:arylsulfatase A-like enzyme